MGSRVTSTPADAWQLAEAQAASDVQPARTWAEMFRKVYGMTTQEAEEYAAKLRNMGVIE